MRRTSGERVDDLPPGGDPRACRTRSLAERPGTETAVRTFACAAETRSASARPTAADVRGCASAVQQSGMGVAFATAWDSTPADAVAGVEQ
jgi:hypothetical protein